MNRNHMNLTRRKFLQTSFFTGFAIATKKGWANKRPTLAPERRDLFPQGVASGDPTPGSVILWTRRPPLKDSHCCCRRPRGAAVGVRANSF